MRTLHDAAALYHVLYDALRDIIHALHSVTDVPHDTVNAALAVST